MCNIGILFIALDIITDFLQLQFDLCSQSNYTISQDTLSIAVAEEAFFIITDLQLQLYLHSKNKCTISKIPYLSQL
jgi:hypothetical protein